MLDLARRSIAPALGVLLLAARVSAQEAPASAPSASPVVAAHAEAAPRDVASTTLDAEDGKAIAGAQGDPLKGVQALPGVVRPAFGFGPLVVWGAAPRDTRVYVDGVPIPALYHGGGIRSTIGTGLVSGVELVPGGCGADYGLGLGGIVRVTTAPLPERGVHGFVAGDLLDASTQVSGAVDDRVRAAVAGRVGYADRTLPALGAPHDLGEFVTIPRYQDAQGKVSWKLRDHEQLSATFLESSDAFDRTVPSLDPGAALSLGERHSFQRFSLAYENVPDERTRLSVTPYYGFDHDDSRTTYGAVPNDLDVNTVRYGVRASRDQQVSKKFGLSFGADIEGARSELSRTGSLAVPPREGDVVVFGEPPGNDVNADRWQVNQIDVGPFLVGHVKFGPLMMTEGLRLDGEFLEGNHLNPRIGATPDGGYEHLEVHLEARFEAHCRVSSRLELAASYGDYHAPPAPEDLSAVFGTPRLSASHARHATLGEFITITPSTHLDLVEFDESLSSLVVRNPANPPPLAGALVQTGEGNSFGAQATLRQEAWRGFTGFVAYNIGRSDRRDSNSGPYRLFDYDRTHVVSAVGSQRVGPYTFGVRVAYQTGLPRTPVTGAYYDVQNARYEPLFGAQNSERLPSFFELDLRAARRFVLGPGVDLDVYAELENATFRRNPEAILYSHDYSRHTYVTGLPSLASIGARVGF